MCKALMVVLALMVAGCSLGQPVRQMTEKEWNIVVTVFKQDGSTTQDRYKHYAESAAACMVKAREYGDAVRDDTNTVTILCYLGP